MLQAAHQSATEGRAFAGQIQALAEGQQLRAPAIASAVAIVLAGLIVDLDDCAETLYEHFGFGLATDEARIDLFVDQVLAALEALRAGRTPIAGH